MLISTAAPTPRVYGLEPTFTVLQKLIEFTEGQDSLSTTYLWALEHLESEIVAIQEASLVQGTLDTWLT